MTNNDHVAEALVLRELATKPRSTKSAANLIATAQFHATLALVDAQREANEQARIANLIALGQFRVGVEDLPHLRHLAIQPSGPNDIEPTDDIKKGLGL